MKTCNGIIPKSLEPPQSLLDTSPACPCGTGSSPTASGLLVERHWVIQGASFSPGTAGACGKHPLMPCPKAPGAHSTLAQPRPPLGSRVPQLAPHLYSGSLQEPPIAHVFLDLAPTHV